jgi:hypothetical protein
MSGALAMVPQEPDLTLPEFDLSDVMDQLMSDASYTDWTLERLKDAVDEYCRFLALCRAFPHKSLGIGPDADKIWHRHILNTRKYMGDCQSYFGQYFHHTPLSTEAENIAAQRETNDLFLQIFGISRLPTKECTCVGSGCMNNG